MRALGGSRHDQVRRERNPNAVVARRIGDHLRQSRRVEEDRAEVIGRHGAAGVNATKSADTLLIDEEARGRDRSRQGYHERQGTTPRSTTE
jgi:hypothetical protein